MIPIQKLSPEMAYAARNSLANARSAPSIGAGGFVSTDHKVFGKVVKASSLATGRAIVLEITKGDQTVKVWLEPSEDWAFSGWKAAALLVIRSLEDLANNNVWPRVGPRHRAA